MLYWAFKIILIRTEVVEVTLIRRVMNPLISRFRATLGPWAQSTLMLQGVNLACKGSSGDLVWQWLNRLGVHDCRNGMRSDSFDKVIVNLT